MQKKPTSVKKSNTSIIVLTTVIVNSSFVLAHRDILSLGLLYVLHMFAVAVASIRALSALRSLQLLRDL